MKIIFINTNFISSDNYILATMLSADRRWSYSKEHNIDISALTTSPIELALNIHYIDERVLVDVDRPQHIQRMTVWQQKITIIINIRLYRLTSLDKQKAANIIKQLDNVLKRFVRLVKVQKKGIVQLHSIWKQKHTKINTWQVIALTTMQLSSINQTQYTVEQEMWEKCYGNSRQRRQNKYRKKD